MSEIDYFLQLWCRSNHFDCCNRCNHWPRPRPGQFWLSTIKSSWEEVFFINFGGVCLCSAYRRFHWPSENGYGNELFQNWYFTPFDTFPLPSSCLNVYLWGINFPQHDFFNVREHQHLEHQQRGW